LVDQCEGGAGDIFHRGDSPAFHNTFGHRRLAGSQIADEQDGTGKVWR